MMATTKILSAVANTLLFFCIANHKLMQKSHD